MFQRRPPPKDVAETLYNKYYNSTVRQVTSVIGNQEFAIEATQEAFLRAFERFDTLKDMDKFSSWVVSIAINKARDTMRKRKREVLMEPYTLTEAFGPKEEVVQEYPVNTALVKQAIEMLPPHLKEVVMFFYVQELDIASIANILKIPEGTVKSRLHKARSKLRKIYESSEADDHITANLGLKTGQGLGKGGT